MNAAAATTRLLADQLARSLRLNGEVIRRQLDGLTQADSLVRPPYYGNCLNWVLGHLVVNREPVHTMAGLPLPWPSATYDRYRRDSDPITQPEEALALERIVADLNASTGALLAWLEAETDAGLAALPEGSTRPVGQQISFALWHEAYHVGQTEILRQVAGRADKVI